VLARRALGTDAMGDPVWAWEGVAVPGCLVRPLTGEDAASAEGPDGVRAEYRVAFPKSYAGPPLRHARVALTDRGMDASDPEAALLVVGSPDATDPCPTPWNMLADVGRAYG